MIQDPNPIDDVELEKFTDWLYEVHKPFSLSCKQMQSIWLVGLASRDAFIDTPDRELAMKSLGLKIDHIRAAIAKAEGK